MAVSYIEKPDENMIEFSVSGFITSADYDSVIDPMDAFLDARENVRLLEIVHSFEGFDPKLILPGLRFKSEHMKRFSHVAIVSDIGWFSPIIKAIGTFSSTELRLFSMSELTAARRWLAAA